MIEVEEINSLVPEDLEKMRFPDEKSILDNLEKWGIPMDMIEEGEENISQILEDKTVVDMPRSYYFFKGIPRYAVFGRVSTGYRLSNTTIRLLEKIKEESNAINADALEKMANVGNFRDLASAILSEESIDYIWPSDDRPRYGDV